jgi:hypothetical protein
MIEDRAEAFGWIPDLKKIWIMPGVLESICDQIEAVLAALDSEVRQHDGRLYVLTPDGPVRADAHLLRLRAMRVAFFIDAAKNRLVDPPLKYFAALVRKGTWRFPQLSDDLK